MFIKFIQDTPSMLLKGGDREYITDNLFLERSNPQIKNMNRLSLNESKTYVHIC